MIFDITDRKTTDSTQ